MHFPLVEPDLEVDLKIQKDIEFESSPKKLLNKDTGIRGV